MFVGLGLPSRRFIECFTVWFMEVTMRNVIPWPPSITQPAPPVCTSVTLYLLPSLPPGGENAREVSHSHTYPSLNQAVAMTTASGVEISLILRRCGWKQERSVFRVHPLGGSRSPGCGRSPLIPGMYHTHPYIPQLGKLSPGLHLFMILFMIIRDLLYKPISRLLKMVLDEVMTGLLDDGNILLEWILCKWEFVASCIIVSWCQYDIMMRWWDDEIMTSWCQYEEDPVGTNYQPPLRPSKKCHSGIIDKRVISFFLTFGWKLIFCFSQVLLPCPKNLSLWLCVILLFIDTGFLSEICDTTKLNYMEDEKLSQWDIGWRDTLCLWHRVTLRCVQVTPPGGDLYRCGGRAQRRGSRLGTGIAEASACRGGGRPPPPYSPPPLILRRLPDPPDHYRPQSRGSRYQQWHVPAV